MKKLLSVLLLLVTLSCSKKEDLIEVGQTWKYVSRVGNPYEKAHMEYQKVIDIEGDYVLYVENKTDTLNMSKRLFVVGATLISPKNYKTANDSNK